MEGIQINKELAKAMLAREWEIKDIMQEMVHRQVADSMKALHSKMNKQVYEMAERQGVSIWDICFNYIPRLEYEQVMEEGHKFSLVVKLVPCPLIRDHYKDIEDGTKDVL